MDQRVVVKAEECRRGGVGEGDAAAVIDTKNCLGNRIQNRIEVVTAEYIERSHLGTTSRPSRIAITTASSLECAPSFSMTRCVWLRAVLALIDIADAISIRERPRARYPSSSVSR